MTRFKIRKKIGAVSTRIKTRLRSKSEIAFGNTQTKSQRIKQRICKIAIFAVGAGSLGALLWYLPSTRKIILRVAFKLRAQLVEQFSSATQDSEILVDKTVDRIEKKRLLMSIVMTIGTAVIIALVAQQRDTDVDLPPSRTKIKSIEEPKNPTVKESAGIGPKTWPEVIRVLAQELIMLGYIFGSIGWLAWCEPDDLPDIASNATSVVGNVTNSTSK